MKHTELYCITSFTKQCQQMAEKDRQMRVRCERAKAKASSEAVGRKSHKLAKKSR